ncbi:MAG TPA: hypothetical protein VM146_20085 [Steroidobacteraceae bacterium]|nr:hypothetical protein [Steroidobacteraceae bacterium]
MNEWKRAARKALISGATASLLSTAAMMVAGKVESDAPAGPVNGPSQWVFGRKAAHRRRFNLGYTVTGFLIHHLTATGWALLHERVFGRSKQAQTPARQMRNAAITAAVANFVDYRLTPKRLQPGFDAQLSKKSMFAVYAAFAAGLALYDLATRDRQTKRREE